MSFFFHLRRIKKYNNWLDESWKKFLFEHWIFFIKLIKSAWAELATLGICVADKTIKFTVKVKFIEVNVDWIIPQWKKTRIAIILFACGVRHWSNTVVTWLIMINELQFKTCCLYSKAVCTTQFLNLIVSQKMHFWFCLSNVFLQCTLAMVL